MPLRRAKHVCKKLIATRAYSCKCKCNAVTSRSMCYGSSLAVKDQDFIIGRHRRAVWHSAAQTDLYRSTRNASSVPWHDQRVPVQGHKGTAGERCSCYNVSPRGESDMSRYQALAILHFRSDKKTKRKRDCINTSTPKGINV